jgi:two-component system response regulator DesR
MPAVVPSTPNCAGEAWSEADPLTDRERQVLRLAGEGRSGPEIAADLHLSEGTVRNYLSEAISKLGGRNRVDAARIARAKGWLNRNRKCRQRNRESLT